LVTKKEHSTHFEVWDDQDKQQLAYRTYSKEEMEALRRAKKKGIFYLVAVGCHRRANGCDSF
jgi:hypothetical protein